MNSEESKNDSAPGCDAASAPPGDITARPLSLLPTPPRTDELGHQVTPVGDLDLRQATLRLMRGENLSRIEARHFLSALLNPAATDGQLAAAAAVLAGKGETFDGLAGIAARSAGPARPRRTHNIQPARSANESCSGSVSNSRSLESFVARTGRVGARASRREEGVGCTRN